MESSMFVWHTGLYANLTIMHSSTMHTARSIWEVSPLGPDPSWDQASPWDQTPPWDEALPWTRLSWHQAHPLGPGIPRGQTHTCKHITLPQTSFAGSKYDPCSGRSRILPRTGCQIQRWMWKVIIWSIPPPQNCMKLKEFGLGGHATLAPPLYPPMPWISSLCVWSWKEHMH